MGDRQGVLTGYPLKAARQEDPERDPCLAIWLWIPLLCLPCADDVQVHAVDAKVAATVQDLSRPVFDTARDQKYAS